MLSREERDERRKQLGASEFHKIFNFDNKECQKMWEYKVGKRDREDISNNSMIAGNILEEDALDYYEKERNVCLLRNERIPMKTLPGLIASLDAREEDTSIPVENKIIGEDVWNSWKVTRGGNAMYGEQRISVPRAYYIQLHVQMLVCFVVKGRFNIMTLTDEEKLDPLHVKFTDLHNKIITIDAECNLFNEILNRADYMLWCMGHKRRPSEKEYLERNVF